MEIGVCIESRPHRHVDARDLTSADIGTEVRFPRASIGVWTLSSVTHHGDGLVTISAWCHNLGKRPSRRTSGTLLVGPHYPVEIVATHTPAPAGVSAAPTSRDRPIGPAGAPLYSEDRCDAGHVLDCCGGCKCEGTQHV